MSTLTSIDDLLEQNFIFHIGEREILAHVVDWRNDKIIAGCRNQEYHWINITDLNKIIAYSPVNEIYIALSFSQDMVFICVDFYDEDDPIFGCLWVKVTYDDFLDFIRPINWSELKKPNWKEVGF